VAARTPGSCSIAVRASSLSGAPLIGNSTTGPEAAVRDTASNVEKRRLPMVLSIVAVVFWGVNAKVMAKIGGVWIRD
jgi:hypothetical protein